jgi:hypothetical protein
METNVTIVWDTFVTIFIVNFFLNIGNYFLELTIIPDSIQNQRNHQHVQVLKTGVGQISGQQL